MKAFPWLIRRELWEHRSFYIVPMVFVALLVVFYTWELLSQGPGGLTIEFEGHSGTETSLQQLMEEGDRDTRHVMQLAAGGIPFIVPSVLLSLVMFVVLFFYLTDALYAERKDRSVLFWKSLPLADTPTVLSKFVTAIGVVPAITFVGIIVAAIGLTLANTLFAWSIGESALELVWKQVPFVTGPMTMLYALAVQALWYAPIFAWLLLASAWARRAPALWALSPLALGILESAILRSDHVFQLIGERLTGVFPLAFRDEDMIKERIHQSDGDINWSEAFGMFVDPGSFLTAPGMWIGLVVAAVFLTGAIWLRRYRSEI